MDAADRRAVRWLEGFQERQYSRLGLPLPMVPAVQAMLDGFGDATPFGIDKATVAGKLEGVLLRGDSEPGSRYDDALFRGLSYACEYIVKERDKDTVRVVATSLLSAPVQKLSQIADQWDKNLRNAS